MNTHFQSGFFMITMSSTSNNGDTSPFSLQQQQQHKSTNDNLMTVDDHCCCPPMKLKAHRTTTFLYLLGHSESQFEILSPVFRIQSAVVKSIGIEVMNEGAESHPVAPASGKILDLHVLHGKLNNRHQT